MNGRSTPAVGSVMLVACIALSGCGSGEPANSPPPPPPVQDTVFGDAVGTMDRARAVEDVTMQHKQALDQAIEPTDDSGSADRSPK